MHDEFVYNYIYANDKTRDEILFVRVGKFLQENEEVINLLDKAAEMPACQMDIKYIGVEYSTTRCLGRIRAMAKFQSVRNLYLAETEKGDQAIDSVVSGLRMGRIFENHPELLVALVKLGCWSIACTDISCVMERCRPTEKALIKLQEALKEQEKPQGLEKLMIGQRIYIIAIGVNALPHKLREQVLSGNAEFGECFIFFTGSGSWFYSPWTRQVMAGYLRDMAGFIELLRKPWPEIFWATKEYEYQGENVLEYLRRIACGENMMFSNMAIYVRQYGSAMAMVRCTRTAVAVERFRRVNGRVPASLDELVPEFMQEVPMDPFSGKELLYKLDNDSYTIYSVNENMKDDNGDIIVPGSCADRQFLDRGIRIRFSDQ